MGNTYSSKKRNSIFIFCLLLIIISNYMYFHFMSAFVGMWLLIVFELLVVSLWLLIARKWFMGYQRDFIKAITESSSDSEFIEELSSCVSFDIFPTKILNKLISYQHKQEQKDQSLLKKLINSNILLERNSKITDSIMQITSEILSSGEIDEVLQTILDTAIDIIPNAQKGSILIYNGRHLEFRACHGYEFEVLKHLKLGLEHVFQYHSKDFYEPCIVNNPESYNKEHLENDKFEMLREARGFELKSILSCAIQVDNEFYGIINLDSTEDENAFSNEDKPLIKHLATQTGIALKNARLIERILYLSRHDSLTEIYNRCYFGEVLMRTFQQSKTSGSVFSLAILDINELKLINDTYGHEAGDLLLRKFVLGVKEGLIKDDIFARYGGDEFVIIFAGKSMSQAKEIIDAAQYMFSQVPFTYCGIEITNISFGCGVAEFPAEASELEELIKLADTRMYKNKRKSKKPIR